MTKVEELEKRLNMLAAFGGKISVETHLDHLLELVADQVRQMLNGDRCTVFLIDPLTNELWSKIAHGMGQTEIRVPFGKGVVGIVAQTGQTVNIPDAYTDNRFSHDIDRVTGYRTHNILAVPLKNSKG